MLTDVFWVRHGPTHAKAMVGWTDLPADLSDLEALDRLSAFLPQVATVVSSDLSRARSTADAIQNGRTRLADDPGLREMHFGDWEMKDYTRLDAEDPERIRAFWERPGEVRPPGGESFNDLAERVEMSADRLVAAHGPKPLIIVAHFGAILTQIRRAENLTTTEAFGHRIDNLSVTHLTFDGTWHLKTHNHKP